MKKKTRDRHPKEVEKGTKCRHEIKIWRTIQEREETSKNSRKGMPNWGSYRICFSAGEEDDATWWTWRRERNLITGFMDLPPPQRIHVIDDTARETDRQDRTGQNSVNTCRQERHIRASVEVKQRIRGVHDFLLRIDWIEWHEIPWPGITRHINNCAVVGRTWSN